MATVNFLYRSTKSKSNLVLRLLFRDNGFDYVLGAKTQFEVDKDYWTKQQKLTIMKNLLYLGIILMLASCGSNESESAASNELESAAPNESESAAPNELESAASNESERGSTVKIGNLEVMTEDLGEMNWNEAVKACGYVGDGWRLPTKNELNVLFKSKDKIGGFITDIEPSAYYWSSTESSKDAACFQSFVDGYQTTEYKHRKYRVRAVRYNFNY